MRSCQLCDRPGPIVCPRCRSALVVPPPLVVPGLDRVTALVDYEGPGARLVQRVKFDGRRTLVPTLAAALARAVPQPTVGTTVTWVPTSGPRRRERGFDQAELLARAVARRLDRPVRALLHRHSATAQTGRTAAARRADAPRFGPVPPTVPPEVLLVDDVCTTGATLSAAAGALRAAGAGRVDAIVVARTP